MGKVFLQRGSLYTMTEDNFTVSATLDDGIYQVCANPVTGELFLDKIGNKFEFGFKLYGMDEALIKHVLDTYNKQETKHNLGVLLNGAKGTGKTVTAKYLANKLGLPIIICDTPYRGLATFLASINHDCVFFFDEFEKNFRLECGDDENCAGEDLLSIMDGVYNGDYCHVFLLTTNELRVNDNLLSRPSRIRYLKSFGDVIDRKILEEFVDDNLERKEYKNEIMEFIETLTIATIDIVKSIVEEVNLHNCHIDEFKQFFNVKESNYSYYCRSWAGDVEGDTIGGHTKEEFLKECKTYHTREECDWKPVYDTIYTKRPLNKWKENMKLSEGSRWIIREIDLEASYVVCEDCQNRWRKRHLYIENPEAKPNIYDSASRSSTDPYWFDD